MNFGRRILRYVVTVMVLSLTPVAQATHGVEHRYTIFGRVIDGNQTPVGNVPVLFTGFGGKPLGKATTTAEGNYSILLHVHDQQLGTAFWVTVNNMTKSGTMTFDVSDRNTDRKHRIDFNLSDSE